MKFNPSPINIRTTTAMMQMLNHEIINAAMFYIIWSGSFFLVKISVSNFFVTLQNWTKTYILVFLQLKLETRCWMPKKCHTKEKDNYTEQEVRFETDSEKCISIHNRIINIEFSNLEASWVSVKHFYVILIYIIFSNNDFYRTTMWTSRQGELNLIIVIKDLRIKACFKQ